MAPQRLRRPILIAASIAIAIALGMSVLSLYRELSTRETTLQAAVGGPFSLVSHTGERVSDEKFRGRHMLVYFGYTFCPDVCPTELASMSLTMDLLGGEADEVQPVFITIDPARDTVALIDEYRQHFHPAFTMLTGSDEEIAAAAKAYRVYYAKVGDDDDPDYLMDHSSVVYLMDEKGRYLSHFSAGTAPEDMAKRIREVL